MPTEWIGRKGDLLQPAAKSLAVAIFFVLLALLWTFPLQHVIAYPFIFLFFGAIMCSAWFGGFTGGIWAVALSAACVNFFFLPPLYSFTVGKEFRGFAIAFVICAIAITTVSATRKRTETAIRLAKEELEIRVHERTAELERSNAELKEREGHLRLLTEAIPQQIWRTDQDGVIEYANRNLLDYVARDTEMLRGEGFYAIFHPDDAPIVRAAWEEAQATHTMLEAKARVLGPEGDHRWFLIRGNPQLGSDGSILRWYGVHIDVELQERAQQDLLLAQDRLSSLTRTLSMAEMAASIAHELKQPLTALITHANACRRWLQLQPPNLERATITADRIARETMRASEVVDRVRSLFSRTDYRRDPTDLNALVREFSRVVKEEAKRRRITIRVILAENIPPVFVDPIQLQQVMLNLVMNAMEAIGEQGLHREVEITSARPSQQEVRISVKNYGAAIPGPVKARMFEPFFTTKLHGTGMGLAICRSVIEEHDGKIWVESDEETTAVHFALAIGGQGS